MICEHETFWHACPARIAGLHNVKKLIANKTVTIIENIVLFDVSAYA